MIVDFHTHLLDHGHWPTEWWDYVARQWASEKPDRTPDQIRPKIEAGLVDPDGSRMVSDMDAAGVAQAIILPIDWGPDYHSEKSVTEVTDHAIACQERFPDRLIAFGGVDPRRPGAPDQVEAWLSSGKVHGLKLYPNCGWMPGDARAMEVYEVCAAHDVPILFHTGHPLPLLDESWSRLVNFMPVVEAFPNLKVVLGHAGAPCEFDNALAVAKKSNAATLELSVCLWDDHNEDAELALAARVARARDEIGIERILFGTDHVSGTRVRGPGFLVTLVEKYRRMPEMAKASGATLSASEMERIMGLNALAQLNRTISA